MAWPTKPTEYRFCFAVCFGASCEASLDSSIERLHLLLWTAVEDGHTLSLFHTRARVRAASNSNKVPWAGTSQFERLTYTTKIPDDLFDEGPLCSVSSYVRSGRLLVFLLHISPICDYIALLTNHLQRPRFQIPSHW